MTTSKTKNITLINRTEEKAADLALNGLANMPAFRLNGRGSHPDIILVATNALEPTVLRSHLEGKGQKLIIDLSIPYNVRAGAGAADRYTGQH